MQRQQKETTDNKNGNNVGYESPLWQIADAMCDSIDTMVGRTHRELTDEDISRILGALGDNEFEYAPEDMGRRVQMPDQVHTIAQRLRGRWQTHFSPRPHEPAKPMLFANDRKHC